MLNCRSVNSELNYNFYYILISSSVYWFLWTWHVEIVVPSLIVWLCFQWSCPFLLLCCVFCGVFHTVLLLSSVLTRPPVAVSSSASLSLSAAFSPSELLSSVQHPPLPSGRPKSQQHKQTIIQSDTEAHVQLVVWDNVSHRTLWCAKKNNNTFLKHKMLSVYLRWIKKNNKGTCWSSWTEKYMRSQTFISIYTHYTNPFHRQWWHHHHKLSKDFCIKFFCCDEYTFFNAKSFLLLW